VADEAPAPPGGPADPNDGQDAAARAEATIRSRPYIGLLVLTAIVGVAVSVAAWCFVELNTQLNHELFRHLPHALGYHSGPPAWWPLPVLVVGAAIAGFAIARLPGRGGHVPARGLAMGGAPPTMPELGGIMLAAVASIGFGIVLGPEAPLIALGSGFGAFAIRRAQRGAADQVVTVVAAAGSFAAISFVFGSPLIGAVLLLEAAGLASGQMQVVMLPGLMAAAIGSLVSLGIGSFTGLSSADYSLQPLALPQFTHLTIAEFGWTLALALVVAVGARVLVAGGQRVAARAEGRWLTLCPVLGLVIAGLAILFAQVSGHGTSDVLFSGQDQLGPLVAHAGAYSIGALLLLLACKGGAYALSLGAFRGGPTFPIIFLGGAAGLIAGHLPGFPVTAAVAVGMAAGTTAVLRLPLSAVIIAVLLTAKSGAGITPLAIVAAVTAYVATLDLSALVGRRAEAKAQQAPASR
jgi:H+/Cl- antiporter ClcA